MFGVSLPEMLIVCGVILIVLGPERMPEAARKVAHLLGQFRRHADAVRRELYNSMYPPASDIRREFSQIQSNLRAVKDEITDVLPDEMLNCEQRAKKNAIHADQSAINHAPTADVPLSSAAPSRPEEERADD